MALIGLSFDINFTFKKFYKRNLVRMLDRLGNQTHQGDNSAWSQACAIREFLFGFKFFVKKSQNLVWQVEHNASNLITLLSILSIFQQCKMIKIESLSSSCLIKFWLFLTKHDDFYLKPKRNSRMAEAWDQADLSPWIPLKLNCSGKWIT